MATNDVDQRMLGRVANRTELLNPPVARYLYRLLGLSVMLTKHTRSSELRSSEKLGDDTKAHVASHHIIFLAREGLTVVETFIIPYADSDGASAELRVWAAKLRASFYHMLCLYRNSPAVQHAKPPSRASSRSSATATARAFSPLLPTAGNVQATTPSPSPQPTPPTMGAHHGAITEHGDGNDKENTLQSRQPLSSSPREPKTSAGENPSSSPRNSQGLSTTPPRRRKTPYFREPVLSPASDTSIVTNPFAYTAQSQRRSLHAGQADRRHSYLRDTIPSVLSDSSYVTNPYAGIPPRTTTPFLSRPLRALSPVSSPARFLLPSSNYIPQTLQFFSNASALARAHLTGSAALRLSIAAEFADFLGGCLGDWESGKEVARRAVQDRQRSDEGMEIGGENYDDSAPFVAALVMLAWKSPPRNKGKGGEVALM